MAPEGSSSGDTEPPANEEAVTGEILDKEQKIARAGPLREGTFIQAAVSFRQAPPYPPAEELAKYEEILPGFADRILGLTEQEAAHRIGRERKQDDATIALAKRGQILAFVVVMTLGLGAIVAILTGHSIVGFAALVIAVGTLAGTFIAPRIFSPGRLRLPPAGDDTEQQAEETGDSEAGAET